MPVSLPTFELGGPRDGKMGIGPLGAPSVILKRKFRYTFSIEFTGCAEGEGSEDAKVTIPESYVKLAARPQLDIDEVELNYLNGVTWVPGKGRWQPITITYVDVAGSELMPLYSWIATVYNFASQNPQDHITQSEKKAWNGTGTLTMLDGCGNKLETWELHSMWPQSVNFGDLDYSNSEEATIELTLRYSEVFYTNNCGRQPAECCSGCDTDTLLTNLA